MFYKPELIIYLWMLPVLAMVVLPALWAMICMLYQVVERSRLADVRGCVDFKTGESTGLENQEKRIQGRVRIEGPKASVARQVNCCQTQVANISFQGICLTNIPQKMNYEAYDKLKVAIRTCERDYTMLVQPRWRKLGEKGFMIGAEIVKKPAGWKNFVTGLCQPSAAQAA